MKPTQYQKGYTEFYKLKFKVTPDVLIPRPETELLVDEVLNFLSYPPYTINPTPTTILDIGTGSGNISISIAKHLPTSHVGIQIISTDISQKALKVAKQNAKLHGVGDKIKFIKSDLLSEFNAQTLLMPYTLIIVSNLPYIPSERIPYLDPSVKDFEPLIALDGGQDGFDLYRKLFRQIKSRKLFPSLIIGEIDYTQGDIAYIEATNYFPKSEVQVKTDLAHKQRILEVRGF